jgi:hypothetical protein
MVGTEPYQSARCDVFLTGKSTIYERILNTLIKLDINTEITHLFALHDLWLHFKVRLA